MGRSKGDWRWAQAAGAASGQGGAGGARGEAGKLQGNWGTQLAAECKMSSDTGIEYARGLLLILSCLPPRWWACGR